MTDEPQAAEPIAEPVAEEAQPAEENPYWRIMRGRYGRGFVRRAEVLGDEAQQPADFTARLVDTVPEEQGEEGP